MPLFIIGFHQFGIGFGIGVVNGPAEINGTANHTDTGTVAEHIVRIFAVNTTDDSNTTAVEFGKGVTAGTQDPQFRFVVIGIPLGHGKTTGAD